jgi:hypothetical protein
MSSSLALLCIAPTLAQRAKHETIPNGPGTRKSRRMSGGILPRSRGFGTCSNARTRGRSRRPARRRPRETGVSLAANPSAPSRKRLPHADDALATSGRIHDNVRQPPIQLLRELVPECLVPLRPVCSRSVATLNSRLTQRMRWRPCRHRRYVRPRAAGPRQRRGWCRGSAPAVVAGAYTRTGTPAAAPYAASAAPALPAVGTTSPGTPWARARVTAALSPRALNEAWD